MGTWSKDEKEKEKYRKGQVTKCVDQGRPICVYWDTPNPNCCDLSYSSRSKVKWVTDKEILILYIFRTGSI